MSHGRSSVRELLDALHIEQVDLVGNDSGGGIAQIFAALPKSAGASSTTSGVPTGQRNTEVR